MPRPDFPNARLPDSLGIPLQSCSRQPLPAHRPNPSPAPQSAHLTGEAPGGAGVWIALEFRDLKAKSLPGHFVKFSLLAVCWKWNAEIAVQDLVTVLQQQFLYCIQNSNHPD